MNAIQIGDIVLITADSLIGIDAEESPSVRGEVGIVVDYHEEIDMFQVKTLNYASSEWWYTKEQLDTPSNEDCARNLRKALERLMH